MKESLQIKKLFFDYYLEKIDDPSMQLVTMMDRFRVLEGVVEVIGLNFVKERLEGRGDKEFEHFMEEYCNEEEGDADYETVFKGVAKAFELEMEEEKGEKGDVLVFSYGEKDSIVVEVYDNGENVNFVSYRENSKK